MSLDFMNDACEMFSTKWSRTFEKWLAVMSIDYEPKFANQQFVSEF